MQPGRIYWQMACNSLNTTFCYAGSLKTGVHFYSSSQVVMSLMWRDTQDMFSEESRYSWKHNPLPLPTVPGMCIWHCSQISWSAQFPACPCTVTAAAPSSHQRASPSVKHQQKTASESLRSPAAVTGTADFSPHLGYLSPAHRVVGNKLK